MAINISLYNRMVELYAHTTPLLQPPKTPPPRTNYRAPSRIEHCWNLEM